MRSKQVIASAMHQMMEEPKYLRIATITSFIHALIFNILLLFYLFNYSDLLSTSTSLGKLVHQYIDLVHLDSSMIGRGVLIALILFIGYELIPPIWEAAMIYYLDDPKEPKDDFRALAKWLYKFFPMLEFGVSTSLFKSSFIILVVIRLILFDLWDNTLIIILMAIWITISFFVTLLLPYTKMLICLEGYAFFDAMKRSVSISVQNIWVTAKFVIINFILSIRFFINMAIIIGIPIWLVTLWARLGLQDIWWLNTLFLIILIWLVAFAAYVEWIIEWFFTAAWMYIYKQLPPPEEE